MEELLRRNMLAIRQALDAMNTRSYTQQTQIEELVATVTHLMDRIDTLEKSLHMLRAATTGSGPTVR